MRQTLGSGLEGLMLELDQVPAIRGLTPFDNLLRFMLSTGRFRERCAAAGDLVRLQMPDPSPVVALCSAALTEQVLLTHNRSFIKDRNTRRLIDVIGNGLLVSEGELWRRQRRLAQPAFQRERLARYTVGIVGAAERAISGWSEGQVLDLHTAMMDLSREVMTSTLLSSELGRTAGALGEAIDVVMDRFSDWRFGVVPALARLPLPVNRRFKAARAEMLALVDAIIAERRRSGEDRGDLLSLLLRAQDDSGGPMTDEQLRSEVLVLLLAGHETTALTLSWTFALLARTPTAWARLSAELEAVLGERPVTAADIGQLPYLEAVVHESMRLRPPAWTIGREAIAEVEIGGVRLPRGTQVWMFAWSQHRDPRYFSRPLEFSPERWLDGLLDRLPRCAYFPFGGGPRLCIGNNFAMLEATLLLATIAQSWRPEVAERDDPRPQFSLTLRPRGGLRATLRRPAARRAARDSSRVPARDRLRAADVTTLGGPRPLTERRRAGAAG